MLWGDRMQHKRAILFFIVAAFAVFLCCLAAGRNRDALRVDADYTAKTSVVILDAGHGGYDGGASAADGTLEKDVNLQIVQKLQRLLQVCGVQTVLTRTGDDSIHDAGLTGIRQQKISDIHNRLRIMEQTQNSVFVSIHQNHFASQRYNGTQVFYSGNDPRSRDLAQAVQSAVVAQLQPENMRQIKKSGTEIYLLYHAVRPAVMVECGFLSNPKEAERLRQDEYQQQLALCIYHGLLLFFEQSEGI